MTFVCRASVCVAAVIMLAVSTRADQTYQFTLLNAPFTNTQATAARGINSRGQVVGVYVGFDGSQHGFLYSEGQFESIDVPYSKRTQAYGINDRGDIVGFFDDDRGTHGFRFDGLFATIDVPFKNVTSTTASGINRRGQIVGSYSDFHTTHGFLYERGRFETIDVPGSLLTSVYKVNDHGHMVGVSSDGSRSHGFLFAEGLLTPIGVPFADAFEDGALGINNDDEIVGYFQTGIPSQPTGLRAFLYEKGSFRTIDVTGCFNPMAWDINRAGQIVGDCVDLSDRSRRLGFVATPTH